jgi:hypothetical protein
MLTVPRGYPEETLTREAAPGAVVRVSICVDNIDANRNSMKLRISTSLIDTGGSSSAPSGGVTVSADVDTVPRIRMQVGSAPQETTAEVPFERGEVAAYPFDRYVGSFVLRAVTTASGQPSGEEGAQRGEPVPMELVLIDASIGFLGSGTVEPLGDGFDIHLDLSRTVPVVVWASAMMAMFWILSLAVVAVTLAVVFRLREWESRHLAWLAAMLFAFSTFRATAPGSPPIGVYLDYAAFFWAYGLVVLSLVALVVFYLVGLGPPVDHVDRHVDDHVDDHVG